MSFANDLYRKLKKSNVRIVFAESCTAGMAACEFAKIPGASDILCGSLVTYRIDSKVRWLGVDGETIELLTAVSPPVAHQMAKGALSQTPEANLAVSITGHLGPGAPPEQDGYVFIGLAKRSSGQVTVSQHQLSSSKRTERQTEATELVFQCLLNEIR